MNDAIVIRGARTHNLKNISCEIPHGKLTVVSGVSGSGKSSLAFDTIYAEGQRRYVESLSAYARQFLERIEKPDVDLIDGLAPAIAIKQKNSTRNPRSTVATATEVYDYLRLLYARCGTVHCVHCDGLVKRDSMDEVAEGILALGEGTRLNALFPVRHAVVAPEAEAKPVRRTLKTAAKAAAKPAQESPLTEALKARLIELRASGFNRLYQQGSIFEFSTPESLLDLDFTLPVFVLLDRIVVSAENRARIVDAAEIAYREAGEVIFEEVPREEGAERPRHRFSAAYRVQKLPPAGPRAGAAPVQLQQSLRRLPALPGLRQHDGLRSEAGDSGHIADAGRGRDRPWNRPKYRPWYTEFRRHAVELGVPLDVPWRELPEEARETVLRGKGQHLQAFTAFLRRWNARNTSSMCA